MTQSRSSTLFVYIQLQIQMLNPILLIYGASCDYVSTFI